MKNHELFSNYASATEPLPVSMWAEDDQPINKLLNKGSAALTDAELIAILLGGSNPVDVARKLLLSADNSLHELARKSISEISKLPGIGRARAAAIVAAITIGQRRSETEREDKPRIASSGDAYNLLRADLMDLPHEEFWCLYLNRANRVIHKERISQGRLTGTVADPRMIFKSAVERLACGIICAHNHPSGNLAASQGDIEMTRKLKEAGKFMEIQLLDHVIIAGNKYFSFADEGMI